jgi:hypothetical protein
MVRVSFAVNVEIEIENKDEVISSQGRSFHRIGNHIPIVRWFIHRGIDKKVEKELRGQMNVELPQGLKDAVTKSLAAKGLRGVVLVTVRP